MKALPNITIVSLDGEPVRDTAHDVIKLEFLELAKEKKDLPMEAYPILTTEYLLKRMIDLATYKSRSEQRVADEIYKKIVVTEDRIVLEDGELTFLNKIREGFKPYLGGRLFNPFHDVMEAPITL